MDIVGHSGASTTEVHVSGRGKNIREIDLAAVFFTRQDKEMLALITSFDLSHNHIEKLHQLDALVSLTRLHVNHNKISLIGSLPVTITCLDVSHNSLSSLEGIGCLPHLTELNVGYNRLTSLAGLLRSQPIQTLRAEGNRVVSTVALEGMVHLRLLCLDHNLIDNANELLFLSSTPSLEMLSLRENPVTNMNGYRALVARLQSAVLSLDGVPLLHDEASCPLKSKETEKLMSVQQRNAPSMPFSQPTSESAACLLSSAKQFVKSAPQDGDFRGNFTNEAAEGGSACAKKKRVMGTGGVGGADTENVAGDRMALSECNHNRLCRDDGSNNVTLGPKQQQQSTKQGPPKQQEPGKTFKTTKTFSVEETTPLTTPVAVSPSITMERELHNAQLRMEDLRKENNYLRNRNKTVLEQLREARRVISSQLEEINKLRMRLSVVEEKEKTLASRLDRVKRSARVVDRHTHNTVDAMVVEQERMKALYETQLADLRQQLRRSQRQLATAVTSKVSQPQKSNKTIPRRPLCTKSREESLGNASVEIQDVLLEDASCAVNGGDDGLCNAPPAAMAGDGRSLNRSGRPSGGDAGKLAGELKNWLYSEMAEDARRAEESRVLSEFCRSLECEDAIEDDGTAVQALTGLKGEF